MADGINDSQFYHPFPEQPKRPVRKAFGGLAQSQSDHLRLLLAIQNLNSWWIAAWLAVHGYSKAFGHQTLAKILDRLGAAPISLGNPGVRPIGSVHICSQQNLSPPDPLGRTCWIFDNFNQFLTFLARQLQDLLVVHRILPESCQIPGLSGFSQPQFQMWTQQSILCE
jgi:hypothetical protein